MQIVVYRRWAGRWGYTGEQLDCNKKKYVLLFCYTVRVVIINNRMYI